MFQQVKPVTLWRSLKALSFRLWDEQRRQLVGYRRLRNIRREMSSPRAGGWAKLEYLFLPGQGGSL
jgi:hypothetical protein